MHGVSGDYSRLRVQGASRHLLGRLVVAQHSGERGLGRGGGVGVPGLCTGSTAREMDEFVLWPGFSSIP
jgi:hypothetical protein